MQRTKPFSPSRFALFAEQRGSLCLEPGDMAANCAPGLFVQNVVAR